MCGSDILLGLIAILFPPLAVWVKRGICSADSLINIALCCLAYLPGLLHAWYIISVTPDPTYEQVAQHDAEQGTVTYYYVQTNGQPQYAPQQGGRQQGASYGTVNASAPNAQFPRQQTKPQPAPAPSAVQPSQAGPSNGDDAPPPSYQQATGDNKVQGP
ncbi:Putative proteolipid membrane potential modulator [Septoria linicola]|uniref:Proteolipid membrane potential modulator n=1 Tax=Septoria linicola TaxID=215465 RepID=A0A9Q9B4A5_9PEZI|nr:Putative proteolipid membrane potential modulator [Septoria linicola]